MVALALQASRADTSMTAIAGNVPGFTLSMSSPQDTSTPLQLSIRLKTTEIGGATRTTV